MAHDHHHHNDSGYYLEQLFTIGCCAAIGGIAVLMYTQGTLKEFLAQRFWLPVLLAGLTLMTLAAIRAVALWRMAGDPHAHHHHDHDDCAHDHCDHDHEHEHHHHPHAHDEGIRTTPAEGAALSLPMVGAAAHHEHHHHDHDHGHDHGHSHDHGWVPVRYLVLLILVLFRFVLPVEALKARSYDAPNVITPTSFSRDNRPVISGLSFVQFERAAYNAKSREQLEGRQATLVGQFFPVPGDDKRFGLIRFKINCCAADAIPLNALVMIDPNWKGEKLNLQERTGQWVEVRGYIHFLEKIGSVQKEYISALIVFPDEKTSPNDLVRVVPTPGNPYAD